MCDSVHRWGLRQGEPLSKENPPGRETPRAGRTPPGKENPQQGELPPPRAGRTPPVRENPPGRENPPAGRTPRQGDPPCKENPPRHTVNEWPVRILLECILVLNKFAVADPGFSRGGTPTPKLGVLHENETIWTGGRVLWIRQWFAKHAHALSNLRVERQIRGPTMNFRGLGFKVFKSSPSFAQHVPFQNCVDSFHSGFYFSCLLFSKACFGMSRRARYY